ncbi:MAG: hypothetical protein HRU17_20795 [Polyangiaceae bacterium]|nr:hypothetical protein [Polyangiaceae bacterium]
MSKKDRSGQAIDSVEFLDTAQFIKEQFTCARRSLGSNVVGASGTRSTRTTWNAQFFTTKYSGGFGDSDSNLR